jgi:hypothetical protein
MGLFKSRVTNPHAGANFLIKILDIFLPSVTLQKGQNYNDEKKEKKILVFTSQPLPTIGQTSHFVTIHQKHDWPNQLFCNDSPKN